VDEDDTRSFKVRKKTWGGMGDLWDPADVPIKLKPKKIEEPVTQSDEASTSTLIAPASSTLGEPGVTSERPKWTTKGWNAPGTSSASQTEDGTSSTTPEDNSTNLTKVEDDLPPIKTEETAEDIALAPDVKPSPEVVKTEDIVKTEAPDTLPPPNTSGMFRKRKVPAGSAGSRAKR
jgi:WW domain-binding protein 4